MDYKYHGIIIIIRSAMIAKRQAVRLQHYNKIVLLLTDVQITSEEQQALGAAYFIISANK